jgi:hypothetical protein
MNSRFTSIDARLCGVMLAPVGTRAQKKHVALQHCPGEGSGGSS